jgi:hypothetical protein
MVEKDGDRDRGRYSRRTFLKGSAIGAGAAVADTSFLGGLAHAASNPVAVENALPGTDDDWDVYGDSSIEGFATQHSVNAGETVQFKISTQATSYRIRIYRLGWYGGKGARRVAEMLPSVSLPQVQPDPHFDGATNTTDCGNWAVSASWNVPGDALSGIYVANLERTDGSNLRNRIIFVVRNDGRPRDILVQTSDTTYQAYNGWGGYDLYTGATKVSYNRPYQPQEIENDFFYSELPLVRWLERNGFDVAYCGSADTDSRPQEILASKVFVSSGHDEYWSGAMRSNVESARDAGVNLIFMTGNEVFWKVRWQNSLVGPSTPYRTLVCYKETLANAKVDPSPEWTGTWRDPRFSPPSDGGRPENSLTGTLFRAINPNIDTDFAIKVPAAYGRLRVWRNTSVASLAPNATATLAPETLGYEWNTDADNGHRPAGLIRLSETTEIATQVLQDFGGTYTTAPLTHYMTMYRTSSGALVWSTGTVQWSWGLDDYHLTNPNPAAPPDSRMQQATLNVLADMGVQPATRQSGLVAATKSADAIAPASTITAPAVGASAQVGTAVTVTGTAIDSGGGVVAAVEVSVDGGVTWRAAVGSTSWSYTFTVSQVGQTTIRSRAVDDSCNVESPGPGRTFTGLSRQPPMSIWPEGTVPAVAASGDGAAYELGLKFRTSQPGFVTAVRFYKGPGNTGQHVGRIWSAAGTLLGSSTFTGETATGWQTAALAQPVPVSAGVTYVVSYTAPNGNYALNPSGLVEAFELAPLRALGAGDDGPNGVFGAPGAFPTQSYGSNNYWVDIVFDDDNARDPEVVDFSPARDVSCVDVASTVTARLSESLQTGSARLTLVGPAGGAVPGSTSFDTGSLTVTFAPTAPLQAATTYTATLSDAVDQAGNEMAAPFQWSFTTAAPVGSLPTSIWTSLATPAVASAADASPLELGLRFRSQIDAQAIAVRFFKGPGNIGTHVGRLWSAAGGLLGTATFADESATGWQEARFAEPIPISANTTYVVSYHAPNGSYSITPAAFAVAGVVRGPIEALSTAATGGNGVFNYNAGGGYPTVAYNASNYWVDVVIDAVPDVTPPSVVNVIPAPDIQSVSPTSPISVVFDEPIDAGSLVFELRDAVGGDVASSVAIVGSTEAELTPDSPLSFGATYTATVSASDVAGQSMPQPLLWSFTTKSAPGLTPASVFDTAAVPDTPSTNDTNAVELGMRFTTDRDGVITAVRFYRGPGNAGHHVGRLWSAAGTQLGSVVFGAETSVGWQQAEFPTPISIQAGQIYVVSYHAPSGGYAHTDLGLDAGVDTAPLHALPNTSSGRNGVYGYGPGGFPTNSYRSANYFVDVVFVDRLGPSVASQTPASGVIGVDPGATISVVFTEPIDHATVDAQLRDGGGALVPIDVEPTSPTEILIRPSSALAGGGTYTVTVAAVNDLEGNPIAAPYSGSFTIRGDALFSLFGSETPAVASANDPSAIELGMRFQVTEPCEVVGARFHQGPANSGPHVARLYDASGTLLAAAPYGAEDDRGWRFVAFASPVPIQPGQTFVVSYFTPTGGYSVDGAYFTSDVVNGPIVAPGSNNGVYAYGGGYPTGTYNAANYWVDVVVRPTT